MENKFKVGDRVCFVADHAHTLETVITTGMGGEVKAITEHGKIIVSCDNIFASINASELSIIKPVGPRHAFLMELKTLLEKYDAEIVAFVGEDDVMHDDKPMIYIEFGNNVLNFENYESESECCVINADNVMDAE